MATRQRHTHTRRLRTTDTHIDDVDTNTKIDVVHKQLCDILKVTINIMDDHKANLKISDRQL